MKRIRVYTFGAPEVMRMEYEMGLPPLLPGTFRIQIRGIGVNPVDTYIREGKYGRLPQLPYTPGTDFSGIINGISDSFEEPFPAKFQIGSRVFGRINPFRSQPARKPVIHSEVSQSLNLEFMEHHGTYAEYCLVNPHVDIIDILPDHVDFEAGAAATTTYLTAYRSLFVKGRCLPGQTVLVHGGSGGVGTAAIEMAKHNGAITIATAGTKAGIAICKEAGASHVLNHNEEGYIEELMSITQGEGVDLIVESAADRNLQNDCNIVKPNGKIIIVGCRGPIEISPRELMTREASICGLSNSLHIG